ncbi:MAG TPA: hypothetical protein VFF15_08460 [Flavobacteriaceae bacterium]|nr:hypothetical protein [Flavobacteriaceae bacterium]
MKKVFFIMLSTLLCVSLNAQTQGELVKHYEAYYAQMKKQGDVQGIIDAMTHLNVLQPSAARLDTLAYIYMSDGRYVQALNTIGFEHDANASDIAVEVKAVSLKALSELERALEHFNELYKRNANPLLAYELAEINLQLEHLEEAKKLINYGIANVKDTSMKGFYETQRPYQVPLKAAFYYLKGLLVYTEDRDANLERALGFIDQAMALAPNFNMARVTKEALLNNQKPVEPLPSAED